MVDAIRKGEGEEWIEREREGQSELGFELAAWIRVFVGSVLGWACQADAHGRARAAPYSRYIWAGYEGCRSARAFVRDLRGLVRSIFFYRSVAGRPVRTFEMDTRGPGVDVLTLFISLTEPTNCFYTILELW